jgi:hypothetical protein
MMGEIERHYKRLVLIKTIFIAITCIVSAALGNKFGITAYSLSLDSGKPERVAQELKRFFL